MTRCSLFHSFILSQLWTVYLEYVTPTGNTKEEQLLAPSILLDFWVKVTPGILQLVSHSKVLLRSILQKFQHCKNVGFPHKFRFWPKW